MSRLTLQNKSLFKIWQIQIRLINPFNNISVCFPDCFAHQINKLNGYVCCIIRIKTDGDLFFAGFGNKFKSADFMVCSVTPVTENTNVKVPHVKKWSLDDCWVNGVFWLVVIVIGTFTSTLFPFLKPVCNEVRVMELCLPDTNIEEDMGVRFILLSHIFLLVTSKALALISGLLFHLVCWAVRVGLIRPMCKQCIYHRVRLARILCRWTYFWFWMLT